MDLDVVFLGTAGATPTARRAPAATLIRRGGDRILLDCGEGTQRQLLRSQIGLVDLDVVLFSHYHADHVLGLPGLLKTYDLRGREQGLELYGPSGLSDLLTIFAPIIGRLAFPLHARELAGGDEVPGDGFRLIAHSTDHRGPAVAWELCEDERPGQFDVEAARRLGVPEGPAFGELQRGGSVTTADGAVVAAAAVVGAARRGRTLVFSGDTRPCAAVRRAALGADLLVHEASFATEDRERARETRHSTAAEAAELAAASSVKLLALTHLGARAAARVIKDEARAIFANTVVPRDFDTIELPLPERGAPELRRGGAHPEEEKAR
ncbi:MAG: ribonuclease [Gaiellales bacterium]|nr:ribonuclease [Gaiellales bacterium]